MKFHSKFFNSNYLEAYRKIPTLTIEQAYVYCYNDLKLMHRGGIYHGKRHDAALSDLNRLSDMLIDTHLQQAGFDLVVSPQRCLAYERVDS